MSLAWPPSASFFCNYFVHCMWIRKNIYYQLYTIHILYNDNVSDIENENLLSSLCRMTEPVYVRQNRSMWDTTGLCETQPVYVRQNRSMWDRTSLCETEPVYVRHNRSMWDRTGLCETEPVYVRQNRSMRDRTGLCETQPVYVRQGTVYLLIARTTPWARLKHSKWYTQRITQQWERERDITGLCETRDSLSVDCEDIMSKIETREMVYSKILLTTSKL